MSEEHSDFGQPKVKNWQILEKRIEKLEKQIALIKITKAQELCGNCKKLNDKLIAEFLREQESALKEIIHMYVSGCKIIELYDKIAGLLKDSIDYWEEKLT